MVIDPTGGIAVVEGAQIRGLNLNHWFKARPLSSGLRDGFKGEPEGCSHQAHPSRGVLMSFHSFM